MRIPRLALVENSEGAGRFRGGLGLRKDYLFDRPTTYTILADRDRFGPWGAFGGHDASVAEYVLDPRRRREAARLEGDGRARARRRDQRADVRRRRLRAARGARAGGGRCATSRRGRSVARARARRVPRRAAGRRGRRGCDGGAARVTGVGRARRVRRPWRPSRSPGSRAWPKRTCPFRPLGLPTSRPYAIEPIAEIATCLQRKCANFATIRPQATRRLTRARRVASGDRAAPKEARDERPPRRRHRRHVHRRDPDRRGDGPRRDREGALDAGRPVGRVHGRGRARARRGRDRRRRSVSFVFHATTVATNAIIEGKIARSGFVTTDGFRDLLEIARQVRPTLYDTQFEKPRPLVPRDRAVGVVERLGPKGEVLDAARRRLGARRGRAAARAGRRVRRGLPAALVRQPGARAARRRDPRRGAARRAGLALGRGRARVPRVPARVDDRHQRRDPAGRRALPRAASRSGSPRPGSRRSCS